MLTILASGQLILHMVGTVFMKAMVNNSVMEPQKNTPTEEMLRKIKEQADRSYQIVLNSLWRLELKKVALLMSVNAQAPSFDVLGNRNN